MAKNNRPPLEMEGLEENLIRSSGRGADAFFSTPTTPKTVNKPTQEETAESPTPIQEKKDKNPEVKASERRHDVVTSSRQDVDLRSWRDIIENTETHNTSLRVTNE